MKLAGQFPSFDQFPTLIFDVLSQLHSGLVSIPESTGAWFVTPSRSVPGSGRTTSLPPPALLVLEEPDASRCPLLLVHDPHQGPELGAFAQLQQPGPDARRHLLDPRLGVTLRLTSLRSGRHRD